MKSQWMEDNPQGKNETTDSYNIRHIDECEGCSVCEWYLMEFYSGCEKCGNTGHMAAMEYIDELNGFLCFSCMEEEMNNE